MNKLIFQITIILITTISGLTNAQWFEQNSPNPNSVLRDIFVIDETTAVAVGSQYIYGGIVLKTTDGINWISLPIDSTSYIQSVYFLNNTVGWIVGSGTQEKAIQKTTDGGLTWTGQYGGYENSVHTIHFVDEDTGWAAGSYDGGVYFRYILKTTDGGINWFSPNLSVPLVDLFFFVDIYTGWIVSNSNLWGGGPATIRKTTDAGINWTIQSEVDYRINSIHFVDQNIGWMTGSDINSGYGIVVKTTDGGETWVSQLTGLTSELYDIYFIDVYTGWVVGSGGVIMKTTDGGNNWFSQESWTNHNLNAIQFFNENIGWAIGDSGTILNTTNGGVTFLVEENNFTQPDGYELSQNYPNPFNPSTKITYSIPEAGNVKVSVYNLVGEEVAALVNGFNQAGTFDLLFDATNLPSGLYFYQLKVADFIETKKMVLLK